MQVQATVQPRKLAEKKRRVRKGAATNDLVVSAPTESNET